MASATKAEQQIVDALLAAASRVERSLDLGLSLIHGLSLSEYSILRALLEEHGRSATRVRLAELVGLTPSGVTRALRPMEKLGYVTTERDARDARRSLATLTKAGAKLAQNAAKIVGQTVAELEPLRELDAEEKARTLAFLERLGRG